MCLPSVYDHSLLTGNGLSVNTFVASLSNSQGIRALEMMRITGNLADAVSQRKKRI
jgi:hypothetical protein